MFQLHEGLICVCTRPRSWPKDAGVPRRRPTVASSRSVRRWPVELRWMARSPRPRAPGPP
jgi:hypothetical protein